MSTQSAVRNFRRNLLAPFYMSPEFVIIGAQKAGTTSLYDYLVQHPCIAPARTKEVHFFDHRWQQGIGWYARRFPLQREKKKAGKPLGHELITGEASPYYLFHPHVPRRIKETLPDAKLIVLLRNPVDRAYSHYNMNVSKKTYKDTATGKDLPREPLSFDDAIKAEEERIAGEWAKMLADENYRSFALQLHSYKARGVYVDQLKMWLELFPREQLLILNSEKFAKNTLEEFGRVLDYLGLPQWQPESFGRSNEGKYGDAMKPETRAALVEYFRPHNARLYEFLGETYDWDK
jgi:hypothetical protein